MTFYRTTQGNAFDTKEIRRWLSRFGPVKPGRISQNDLDDYASVLDNVPSKAVKTAF